MKVFFRKVFAVIVAFSGYISYKVYKKIS